jgi:hypothetical protein
VIDMLDFKNSMDKKKYLQPHWTEYKYEVVP